MQTLILNKDNVRGFTWHKPYIIISSTEPTLHNAIFKKDANRISYLRLFYADTDDINSKYIFKYAHAEILLNFYEKYRGSVDLIVSQCDAGISRSAAIAAAICKIEKDEDQEYNIFNNKYRPNMHVYRTILNQYYYGGKEYE